MGGGGIIIGDDDSATAAATTTTAKLTKTIIDNLELQKSVLIQYLHTYELTNEEEAAVETKRDLEEIERRIRELRRRLK